MNTWNVYIIYHKKAKYDLQDNIIFNVSVSSLLKLVAESTTCMKSTPAIQADATSGKKNICKNFINNELWLKICILIYIKMESLRIINSNSIHLLSNM